MLLDAEVQTGGCKQIGFAVPELCDGWPGESWSGLAPLVAF